ncbi:MAG: hypothetical protein LQ351_007536 [Letrouitia transgressa]|nr:MAG: hypothetical protein LQ351_007536 [Letrouitia transgressa]
MPSADSNHRKERLLRLTILIYRKSTVTEDEFHKRWLTRQGPLVREWLARHGVLKYIQERLVSVLGDLVKGKLADYDGFVELYVRESEFERLKRAREDPYYKDVVAPDEKEFIDGEKSRMILGWEEVFIEDGKIVDNGDAKHG